jgi:type IV secretory pathway TrbD component
MAAPETPQGYRAQIHQAIWKKVTMFGAPKMVSCIWLAICLQVALVLLPLAGFRWAGGAIMVWCLGQGVLIGLTAWEPQWDEMALAQLTRRYKSYYEAG